MVIDNKRPSYCENPGMRCPSKQRDPKTLEYDCATCIWAQVPPVMPLKCALCDASDQSISVNCYNCGNVFHMHFRQLEKVPPGTIVAADCPYCRRPNAWRRTTSGVEHSGPVPSFGQPIMDLRGTK